MVWWHGLAQPIKYSSFMLFHAAKKNRAAKLKHANSNF